MGKIYEGYKKSFAASPYEAMSIEVWRNKYDLAVA